MNNYFVDKHTNYLYIYK